MVNLIIVKYIVNINVLGIFIFFFVIGWLKVFVIMLLMWWFIIWLMIVVDVDSILIFNKFVKSIVVFIYWGVVKYIFINVVNKRSIIILGFVNL